MKKQERTSPKELALEIVSQTEGTTSQEMLKHRADGTAYTLDALTLARRMAERLSHCGEFPRGSVTLEYPGGKTKKLGAHQCNARICPRCSYRRGKRLGGEMDGALKLIEEWGWKEDRIRFATLTIPNATNAEKALDKIMAAWHRTLATKTWGRMIAGGFRAVEVKPGKDGRWNVHLHAIVYLWTQGVPYKLIRGAWDTAAGGKYNQRYDELRKKAKAHPGESKAAAAARYLVKYLVKTEEAKNAATMPGKLPHMLAAMYGRRLFGAWGLGAAALRIERHERPQWARQYNRHLEGYLLDGMVPIGATLETPWETARIEVPLPPLPAAFRREDVPDQAEPKPTPWNIRKITTHSPLETHPWRKIPGASRVRKTKSDLEKWLERPDTKAPQPFRWRKWYAAAPKTWTPEAETMLGEQTRTPMLGATLWSRVQKPDEGYPQPERAEHIAHLLDEAYTDGIRIARRNLSNACTPGERIAYLARLPVHIRQNLEELEWP